MGRMALDLDLNPGNQRKQESPVKVSDRIAIDIVAVSGATGIKEFQAILEYDPEFLEYVDFQAQDLMSNGKVVVDKPSRSKVRVGAVAQNNSVFRDTGSLGHTAFKVLEGFVPGEEATIRLREPHFDGPLSDWPAGATLSLWRGPKEDFDENGLVDFKDFLAFASRFGSTQADMDFDPKFDLNGDGSVNFPDFLQFARAFHIVAE